MGPVDPEIIWLKLKKEEITEGKINSPVGKFAEWSKNEKYTKKLRKQKMFKKYKHSLEFLYLD